MHEAECQMRKQRINARAICRGAFRQGDAFVQKITGSADVDRPLQHIREFRNRPNPQVVVTVDIISTSVDIPALEFVVFLRPVKSRILWAQMLGRGTRVRTPAIRFRGRRQRKETDVAINQFAEPRSWFANSEDQLMMNS
jgi:type I site-specific restriction endonuclease